jgi:hypothetical protein
MGGRTATWPQIGPFGLSAVVVTEGGTFASMDFPLRRTLTVRLSEEAFDGWHRLADDNGVSVTAMIEAVGLNMELVRSTSEVAPVVRDEARRVDRERRRRSS